MTRPRSTTLEDLNKKYASKNVKVVSRSINPNYVTVEFVKCGHTKEISITSLKNNTPFCSTCYENNLKYLLDRLGFYLWSKCQSGTDCLVKTKLSQRLVSCKECGYWKIILPSSVKSGNVKCINCERIAAELIVPEEFLLINRVDKNYVKLLHKSCNNALLIQLSNLKRHYPTCPFCDKIINKSFVYLIQIRKQNFKSILKVGKSNNPYLRIMDMSDSTLKIDLICSLKFNSEVEAFEFEKEVHKSFCDYNLPPEVCKSYISSGFTECYPIDVINEIRRKFEIA